MADREKLLKILNVPIYPHENIDPLEAVADYLLDNDVVPVVRCKECMWARPKDHREPTDTLRELICQCAHHQPIPAPWGARMAVKPDDFCSYGERRTDGGRTAV